MAVANLKIAKRMYVDGIAIDRIRIQPLNAIAPTTIARIKKRTLKNIRITPVLPKIGLSPKCVGKKMVATSPVTTFPITSPLIIRGRSA